MLSLSIRQPWAWLIIQGFKDIENRSWEVHYRGSILIHASKSNGKTEYAIAQQLICDRSLSIKIPPLEHLPTGGIVGVANLTTITTDSPSPWAIAGQYHWHLSHPRPVDFHPCKGQQGLFSAHHPAIEPLPRPRAHVLGDDPCPCGAMTALDCAGECGWVPRPRAHVLGEVQPCP
jgi:hypothetical protein